MSQTVRRWAAEFIGTYGFVVIGAGTGIVATTKLGDYGLLGVAIGNGIALGVMITTFMATSGSHYNPAITLSAFVGRKISAFEAVGYVAAQILRALCAAM